MSKKLPAFLFYPGDWRKDPGVQSMDYEERGVWHELLCIMHESENRGMLTLGNLPVDKSVDKSRLARLLGISEKKTRKFLQNFLEIHVLRVCPLTGVFYNRRMVKDEQIRQAKIRAGRAGKGKSGNPKFKKGQANPYAEHNAEHNAEDNSKGGSSVSVSYSSSYKNNNRSRVASNPTPAAAKGKKEKPDLDAAELPGEPDPEARENWLALFSYWRQQYGHPKAKFTRDREAKLRARLREGYSLDECAAAIRGLKRSRFHMGANSEGRRWDEFERIFKSGSNLEKFRDLERDAT